MSLSEDYFSEEIHPIDIVETLAQNHAWEFDRVTDDQIAMAVEGQWRTYSLTLAWSAQDETLRLKTGNAFDLVGERTRVNFTKANNRDEATETFHIELRNRKDEATEIRVVEHLVRWANWEIKESSQEHEKLNAQRIEFRVPLAAGETKTVTYTVRYTW